MCVTPKVVKLQNKPDARFIEAPCGLCWACLKNRENDLIGRGLCELSTANSAWYLTLTYDDRKVVDDNQLKFIQKHDFQNFCKSLRNKTKKSPSHKFKYICAGEYGDKKRRTHFHAAIFWLGMPPEIKKYWNGFPALDAWPWGHVDIQQEVNRSNLKYIVKYLTKEKRLLARNKNIGQDQSWVSYSTKPILGYEYIRQKAMRQAEMRVMPQTMNYMPPGGDTRNRYSFYGKAQEIYFSTLFDHWPEAVNAKCNEWIYNARLRYFKKMQQKYWELLPATEQNRILLDEMSPRKIKQLTKEQTLADKWKEYDRNLQGWDRWRENQKKER